MGRPPGPPPGWAYDTEVINKKNSSVAVEKSLVVVIFIGVERLSCNIHEVCLMVHLLLVEEKKIIRCVSS
jgi:hypothetical protein